MEGQESKEVLAALRRRLRYRAWRRGTREMDLLLGGFADAKLEGMSPSMLALFEVFLNQPDYEIYDWLLGFAAEPPGEENDLTRCLRAWHEANSKA